MHIIETERLIGISDLCIENGRLCCPVKSSEAIDILNLKPSSGRESAFLFYNKSCRDTLICHIGITWKRGRTEISYGTVSGYRKMGYMQEALDGLIKWIIKNTTENQIWGLPNGDESQHILEKCGFVSNKIEETDSLYNWFLFNINH